MTLSTGYRTCTARTFVHKKFFLPICGDSATNVTKKAYVNYRSLRPALRTATHLRRFMGLETGYG